MSHWIAPEKLVNSYNTSSVLHLEGNWGGLNFAEFQEWLKFHEPSVEEAFLIKDGHKTELPKTYFDSAMKGGNKVLSKINKSEVLKRIQNDHSLVVKNFEALHPKAFETALQVGLSLQAIPHGNLYITPAGVQTFEPHTDPYDLIIIQLDGKKNWEIDGHGAINMKKGDMLFIPAGTKHSAVAETLSIHLSIGLYPVTLKDILKEMVDSTEKTSLKSSHLLDVSHAMTSLKNEISKMNDEKLSEIINKAIRSKMKEEWVPEKFVFFASHEDSLVITTGQAQLILEGDVEELMSLISGSHSDEDWAKYPEVHAELKRLKVLR